MQLNTNEIQTTKLNLAQQYYPHNRLNAKSMNMLLFHNLKFYILQQK